MRDFFLFSNLSDEDLKKIEKFSFIHNVKRGDIVFFEKEEPKYLHILYKGEAKVYKVDNKGNEIIIHKFKAPSLIAELANLENIPFPANCAMESEGIIIKVDFKKFEEFLQEGKICFLIMKSLLKKMKRLDSLIQDNLVLDTENKIAKFIYENKEAFEELKQHNIAKLLNIKPETLSRKLKKFKDLGIIENRGSHLKVKNREKIKEYFKW